MIDPERKFQGFGLKTRSLLLTTMVWLTMLRTARDLTSLCLISFLSVAFASYGGGDYCTANVTFG